MIIFPPRAIKGAKSACHYLDSLMLVDAKAVHQTYNLLAVLAHARLALSRDRLLVQYRPLHRNIECHPLVLFDLRYGKTL